MDLDLAATRKRLAHTPTLSPLPSQWGEGEVCGSCRFNLLFMGSSAHDLVRGVNRQREKKARAGTPSAQPLRRAEAVRRPAVAILARTGPHVSNF
jgi:hypothetical protein